MECTKCHQKGKLVKAKNELREEVFICEQCYETLCEGFELMEE